MIWCLEYVFDTVGRSKKVQIFLLTYLAYTVLYSTRKPFSVVKTRLQDDLDISTYWLGIIDTSFLASYALGQIVLPMIMSRWLRTTHSRLLFCLYIGSGFVSIIFGCVSTPAAFSALWVLNGIFHSVVFPVLISIVSPYFGSSKRGQALGTWTTSQQVGGMVSTVFAAYMGERLGWRVVFILPGILTMTFGCFLYRTLELFSKGIQDEASIFPAINHAGPSGILGPSNSFTSNVGSFGAKDPGKSSAPSSPAALVAPATIEMTRSWGNTGQWQGNEQWKDAWQGKSEGWQDPSQASTIPPDRAKPDWHKDGVSNCSTDRTILDVESALPSNVKDVARDLSLSDIIRIQDLVPVSASYFCIKCIRYSLLFWLPFYLATELHYSNSVAGYASLSFDIGGIIGGLAVGKFADACVGGRRFLVASISCVSMAAALLAFLLSAHMSAIVAQGLMIIVGFAVAGADSIIGGSGATDLCERAGLSTELLSSISGVVNGVGSVGAVVQGYLSAHISEVYGWGALYALLAATGLASSILLAMPAWRESVSHARTIIL